MAMPKIMEKLRSDGLVFPVFFFGWLLLMAYSICLIFCSNCNVCPYFLLTTCVMLILYLSLLCIADALWKDIRICLIVCFLVLAFGVLAGAAVFQIVDSGREADRVNFNVTSASLTQFSLSKDTTTLNFNLTVNVTVGPNKKKDGVYYETLEFWASYLGHNFTSLSLPPFYVGGKNNRSHNSTVVLLQPLVFQGSDNLPDMRPDGMKRYRQDKAAGRFSIDLTMSYTGFRGHQELKGRDTFALKELPLPNATSGWLEDAGAADARDKVVALVLLLSFFTVLLLCYVGCRPRKYFFGCFLLPLIYIAIIIPNLIRVSKTSNEVKLSISNATLTQFNFPSTNTNNTLVYNLSLAITIGPYEKETGVYFNEIEAAAYYQGQSFASLRLCHLYLQGRQEHGSRTVVLHPRLQGKQDLLLSCDGSKHYRKETVQGRYSILVTMSYSGIRRDDVYSSGGANGTLTMEAGDGNRLNGVASFELRVPLLANDGAGTASGGGGLADNNNFGFNIAMVLGFLAYGLLLVY